MFRNFRFIKILMRGKNHWIHLPIDLHKSLVFDRDQNGRYQASSYGDLGVSISRGHFKKALFRILESRYSNTSNKIDNITIENVVRN